MKKYYKVNVLDTIFYYAYEKGIMVNRIYYDEHYNRMVDRINRGSNYYKEKDLKNDLNKYTISGGRLKKEDWEKDVFLAFL